MLPVRFEGNGQQNEEAIDDGNETGINWSGCDALPRRDTNGEERDSRRVRQRNWVSPEARDTSAGKNDDESGNAEAAAQISAL